MSDATKTAERRDVFHGLDGPAGSFDVAARSAFAMRLVGPAQRWSLRGDAIGLLAAGNAAGFDLTQPINRMGSASTEARISLRLGPDEWLLIADGEPTIDGDKLAAQIEADLGAAIHTLVDVSHRNFALEMTGARAADVINTGCPLDLDDKAFPVGMATRTLFAKTEIVLVRCENRDGLPLYRIECWRSFGRYLHAHLADSAALLGATT